MAFKVLFSKNDVTDSLLKDNDKLLRINYRGLSAASAVCYERLREAIDKRERAIIFKTDNVTKDDIFEAFSALIADDPGLFFVSSIYQICVRKKAITLRIEYTYNEKEIERHNSELRKIAKDLCSDLPLNEFGKEKKIHDRLNFIKYQRFIQDDTKYTVIGALEKGIAVCSGISRAMCYILCTAGIKCGCIVGEANGEKHMWNIVQIGGQFYHLDVTTDLKENNISYGFFNLPDCLMSRVCQWNRDIVECNSDTFNYYYVNNSVAYDIEGLVQIIASRILEGRKELSVMLWNTDIELDEEDFIRINDDVIALVDIDYCLSFGYTVQCQIVDVTVT